MARLPDEVVERIKREISVQRLAEARGIKLRRSGKELIGLCPFHKDINPSLNIDPVKNVWQCKGACGKSGSVIDWVMLAEGVSVRHALELLCRDYLPSAANATEPPPRKSTTVKLPPLVEHTADDKQLLERVVSHYHEALKNSPAAQQYLVKRGLQSAEMVEQFRLGFADRSLGYRVPASNRAAGIEQRGRLQQLGILRQNGREHLRGSVVVPIFNLEGKVMQMYGRKIAPRHLLREDTSEHLYLPGPHRGVWNEPALIASKEIILCEALIDALTFWCAGYRHVTTSYGVNGFTEEIKTAFQEHGTKRIYIAYDRDEAGERAAQKHAEELIAMGIECFRVQFLRGQDANEFALKNQPAAKFLGMYLSSAAWLGKSKRPTVAVIEPRKIEPQPSAVIEEDTIKYVAKEKISEATEEYIAESLLPLAAEGEEPSTAAKEKISAEESSSEMALPSPISEEPVSSLATQLPIAPLPTGTVVPVREARVEVCGDTVYVTLGERRYRILDLAKNTAPGVLQVNVMVTSTSTRGETRLHVDRFDLYGARPRSLFAKQAAKELGHKEESIERDLARLILELEDLQREWLEKTLTPKDEKDERIAAIAKEYAKSPENTLVISPDNRSRMEINERVHAELQRSGLVSSEEHHIRTLVPRQDLTGADRTWAERYEVGDVLRYSRASKETGIGKGQYAQVKSIDAPKNRLAVELHDGTERIYDPRRQQGVSVFREEMRCFSVGDRIQFTAPANDLRVANRELVTIESIDGDGRLRLKIEGGRMVELDPHKHPHLDHGYAMTSHSSQGQTADRVLIHVDTELGAKDLINSRMAYVSVSRGRYDAQIYTNNAQTLGQELSRDVSHSPAIQQELVAHKIEPQTAHTNQIGQGFGLGL
jgi:DNA primase catalytic core